MDTAALVGGAKALAYSASKVGFEVGITSATTKFVENSIAAWTGSPHSKKKIQQASDGPSIMGSTITMRRSKYADSPILNYMRTNCLLKGNVYVALVPPRMGKTTACHAFMEKYARKGVAFSPTELKGLYYEFVLQKIGIDADNPPRGWLELFLSCLDAGKDSKLPSFLLLDDFANEDSINPFDKVFLTTIKAQIRSRNISVIVLTSNKKSADEMLTWNSFESIRPAVDFATYKKLRMDYKNSLNNGRPPFEMGWSQHLSMQWSTTALKTAVLADPSYLDLSDAEKTGVESEIDGIIRSITPQERVVINPSIILEELSTNLGIHMAPTLTPTNQKRSFWDYFSCGTCRN